MNAAEHKSSEGVAVAGGGSVALFTTVDQVLSSASNALMIFALAQISSVEQFGIVALLVATVSAWIGFNRGSLGTPLLLASNLERRFVTAEAGYAASWSLWTGAVGGVVFIVTGAAFGELWIGLAFALTVPVVLAQDVLRFCAIALGRPALAMASDGFWAVWMLAIFLASLFGVGPSASSTVYLWGAGGLISALALAVTLRVEPRHRRIVQWWCTYLRARLRFGSVYALNQVSAVLVTLAATVIVGSAAAAGIRGAATLFGPIAMLVSALPMVFVPHARRKAGTIGQQWRLLVKTSILTSTMTLVAAGCLMSIPRGLGSVLLGESWNEAVALVPYIGIECAAMCWIVSVYSFLQAQGASQTIFKINLLQVSLQLCFCMLAGFLFGTATAIGCSLAVSGSLSTLVGILVVKARIRMTRGVASCHETPVLRGEVVAR